MGEQTGTRQTKFETVPQSRRKQPILVNPSFGQIGGISRVSGQMEFQTVPQKTAGYGVQLQTVLTTLPTGEGVL